MRIARAILITVAIQTVTYAGKEILRQYRLKHGKRVNN